MKEIIIRTLIIIMAIIIIILTMFSIKYIEMYKIASEPVHSYYIDRELQITYADIMSHNALYEVLSEESKLEKEEILRLIEYIRYVNSYNYDNKYLYVKILYNNKEYDVLQDEDYNSIHKIIENDKDNYSLDCIYFNDRHCEFNRYQLKYENALKDWKKKVFMIL